MATKSLTIELQRLIVEAIAEGEQSVESLAEAWGVTEEVTRQALAFPQWSLAHSLMALDHWHWELAVGRTEAGKSQEPVVRKSR